MWLFVQLTKRSRVDEDATPASEGTNVSRDTQPEADPEQQVDTAEVSAGAVAVNS